MSCPPREDREREAATAEEGRCLHETSSTKWISSTRFCRGAPKPSAMLSCPSLLPLHSLPSWKWVGDSNVSARDDAVSTADSGAPVVVPRETVGGRRTGKSPACVSKDSASFRLGVTSFESTSDRKWESVKSCGATDNPISSASSSESKYEVFGNTRRQRDTVPFPSCGGEDG